MCSRFLSEENLELLFFFFATPFKWPGEARASVALHGAENHTTSELYNNNHKMLTFMCISS